MTHRCDTLSIGFDVRSRCSAGKSKKASKVSLSFVRQATALSYLAPYLSANTLMVGCRTGQRRKSSRRSDFQCHLDRACDLVRDIGSCGPNTAGAWCSGNTSSIAFQKPSAPSPTARVGHDEPRCLMSDEEFTPALCALAGIPQISKPSKYLPGVAPISTSMHSALLLCRACRRTRQPKHTRIAVPRDPTSPSVIMHLPLRVGARLRPATGLARPSPGGRPAPPGNHRPTPRAGRELATSGRGSWSAAPTSAEIADVKRIFFLRANVTSVAHLGAPEPRRALPRFGWSAAVHGRDARCGRPGSCRQFQVLA